jgi:hypothetical protein
LLLRSVAPAAAEIDGWVNSGLDLLTLEVDIAASIELGALTSTGGPV